MASKLPIPSIFSLFFLSIILNFPSETLGQECPYPCYPPPTGPGNNNPPVVNTPPSQVSFPPPSSTNTNNPPIGYFPYNPPPSFDGGVAQPPPEPILPWFPYYYKKAPHQIDGDTSRQPLGTGEI